jgi:hypothetical protein
MTVIQDDAGKYLVVSGQRVLAGPFDTHREAWRWIDAHDDDEADIEETRTRVAAAVRER